MADVMQIAPMTKSEKRTLLLLPCAAIVLFVVGDIALAKYGLDPPYALFFAGVALQLASYACAIATVVFIFVVGVNRWRRTGRRSGTSA